MKRVKLVFVAALGIMGYVGAHAASGFNQTGTQYRRSSGGVYTALPDNRGNEPGQWNCINPDPEETCTYERTTGAPISDANAVQSLTGTFVQN